MPGGKNRVHRQFQRVAPVRRDPECTVREVNVEAELPPMLRRDRVAVRHIDLSTGPDEVPFHLARQAGALPKPMFHKHDVVEIGKHLNAFPPPKHN